LQTPAPAAQPAARLAGQPVGDDRQGGQAMAGQDPADEMVDAVGDDGQRDGVVGAPGGEGREAGIELDLVEHGVELGVGAFDQGDLAAHAGGRIDAAGDPVGLQRLPGRTGQPAQDAVGRVDDRDRPVEIAEHLHRKSITPASRQAA
jgi:hypothetical protein